MLVKKDMIQARSSYRLSDSRIDRTSHQLAPYSDSVLSHFCRTMLSDHWNIPGDGAPGVEADTYGFPTQHTL